MQQIACFVWKHTRLKWKYLQYHKHNCLIFDMLNFPLYALTVITGLFRCHSMSISIENCHAYIYWIWTLVYIFTLGCVVNLWNVQCIKIINLAWEWGYYLTYIFYVIICDTNCSSVLPILTQQNMIMNVRQFHIRKHVCTEKVIVFINFILLIQICEGK